MPSKADAGIINHNHPAYSFWLDKKEGKQNGAYQYSVEICKNIIPNVKTDRPWVTIMIKGLCLDHSIVFIHNNNNQRRYEWLKKKKDLILVCGIPETVEKMRDYADHVIYLPLSIDIAGLEKYKTKKTKGSCFVGRRSKAKGCILPQGIDYISGLPREELLKRLAQYRVAYAVGRCALEALALGCEIRAYDPRFPDPTVWKLLDNKQAAKILQEEIDKIDGRK